MTIQIYKSKQLYDPLLHFMVIRYLHDYRKNPLYLHLRICILDLSAMKIRRSRYLYILLAITALLVGVLYFIAVPVADDYWFMTPRGKAVNFADTFALIRDRLATDQMRLPNQLLPLLLNHMARWLQALLVALLTLLTLIGGVRLASRGDAPTRGYVWAALFMLCLPWYDYLLALSYMLNYVLTSCLILWTIWIFCRRLEEPMGGAASGAVIFLALLAGWSHEAFSVPLFGGLLLWMLMESRHASRMRFYTRGRRRSLDDPSPSGWGCLWP